MKLIDKIQKHIDFLNQAKVEADLYEQPTFHFEKRCLVEPNEPSDEFLKELQDSGEVILLRNKNRRAIAIMMVSFNGRLFKKEIDDLFNGNWEDITECNCPICVLRRALEEEVKKKLQSVKAFEEAEKSGEFENIGLKNKDGEIVGEMLAPKEAAEVIKKKMARADQFKNN